MGITKDCNKEEEGEEGEEEEGEEEEGEEEEGEGEEGEEEEGEKEEGEEEEDKDGGGGEDGHRKGLGFLLAYGDKWRQGAGGRDKP